MNSNIYTRPNKPKFIEVYQRPEIPAMDPKKIPEIVAIDKSSECFVTPAPVVEIMLDHAGLELNHRVLEPSAGTGAILRELPAVSITMVYEINPQLCEILRGAGFDAQPLDFLEQSSKPFFDCVLMNPPFKNLAYIDHIRHAFEFLREGGRLVAVLPPLNSRNKCKSFAAWVEELGGYFEELPAGSFENSGTLANSQLLVLDKSQGASNET